MARFIKEAEWNKKVAIEEARALNESAKLIKESEIIKAQGISEANIPILEVNP